MQIKRKIHRNKSTYWLLLCAVFFRSFIAPGYALTFDSNSPLGLGLILCQGINEIEFFDDVHSGHDHHAGNSLLTTGDDTTGESGTGMTAADSCCWWSTGSQFVYNNGILAALYLQAGRDYYQPSFPDTPYTRHAINPQQPRAPPRSHVV